MEYIKSLCESKNIPYDSFIKEVKNHLEDVGYNLDESVISGVSKILLKEELNHDEIMVRKPKIRSSDLIIVEGNGQQNSFVGIGSDMQIKAFLTKLRLGRRGLESLYKDYEHKLKKTGHRPEFTMALIARERGLPIRAVQIILTKMSQKVLKEEYLEIAELVLEEVPTNTSDGGIPDHKATDGKQCCCDNKLMRRKKLEDIIKNDIK